MKALHINCTQPFIQAGNNKEDYKIDDFEILTTILSALKWREYNGNIKLYTDKLGLNYYQRLGITDIWDLGIDIEVLEGIRNINFQSFWAGGKLFALQAEDTPCCLMDTDFIVWNSITNLIDDKKSNTIVIHREHLMEGIYLPKQYLKTAPGYHFDSKWDWSVLPCNTAFAYFGNDKLKAEYTQEAIRFMKHNLEDAEERISQMVFVEQRLLAMIAEKIGVKVDVFIEDSDRLDKQNYFTHIWGTKKRFRKNKKRREEFCIKCIKRILRDYPRWEKVIHNLEPIKIYLNKIY